MSVLERKEKLLDILNKQRMKSSTKNLLETERDEGKSTVNLHFYESSFFFLSLDKQSITERK